MTLRPQTIRSLADREAEEGPGEAGATGKQQLGGPAASPAALAARLSRRQLHGDVFGPHRPHPLLLSSQREETRAVVPRPLLPPRWPWRPCLRSLAQDTPNRSQVRHETSNRTLIPKRTRAWSPGGSGAGQGWQCGGRAPRGCLALGSPVARASVWAADGGRDEMRRPSAPAGPVRPSPSCRILKGTRFQSLHLLSRRIFPVALRQKNLEGTRQNLTRCQAWVSLGCAPRDKGPCEHTRLTKEQVLPSA